MNPILEEIKNIGEATAEFQKVNDARLAEIEKGNHAKAAELDSKLARIETTLSAAIAAKKDYEREFEAQKTRIELLEALSERPKGNAEEQTKQKYNNAFLAALRKGFKNPNLNADLEKTAEEYKLINKDVTIGSTIGGGFGLPKEIGMAIETLILKFSEVAASVKSIQVGTSDYQELVSIHGSTAAWLSETGDRTSGTTGTPNLRNIKPTWGELCAYPKISEWALQDMQFNAADWIRDDVAQDFAILLSTAIWNGNGSAKPTGMANTAPVATDDYASPMRAAAAFEFHAAGVSGYSPVTAWKGDALIDLQYLLRPGYRTNAKWAMNTNAQGYVRKLKDTTGQYLWQPSLQAGQPDLLLGRPVITWEDMGAPQTLNALPVAYGDFSRGYLLTYRTELLMNNENITTPGYVKFYVRRRYGGMPLNNDAVKFLKVSQS